MKSRPGKPYGLTCGEKMRNFNKGSQDEFRCKGNFKTGEKYCGCNGGIDKMNPGTLEKLDNARDFAGIPLIVDSGYRCWIHNRNVGSTSDNHPNGRAADIRCLNSRTRYIIIAALLKAGFTRLGIHPTFIHADDNPGGVPEVVWLY